MQEKININEDPLVGICIPVYKHEELVKRALDSVLSQSYTHVVVVVVVDNSDDKVIEEYISNIGDERIVYSHNERNIGASANTNRTIRLAVEHGAEYIKILYQDDWFSNEDSLEKIVRFAQKNRSEIIFTGNREIYRDRQFDRICEESFISDVNKDLSCLFRANKLGAPSNLFYKAVSDLYLDSTYTWLLDVDFYLRLAQDRKIDYIYEPLISIGHDGDQLSDFYVGHPFRQLKETYRQYRKYSWLHNKEDRKYLLSQTVFATKKFIKIRLGIKK